VCGGSGADFSRDCCLDQLSHGQANNRSSFAR
jgi:hypothetical protein